MSLIKRDKSKQQEESAVGVVPKGKLLHLDTAQLKPNPNNPRKLFDDAPLRDLKASIRKHGILVPIAVYKLPGQDKYSILDGERRFRCARELEEEGREIKVPANIVEPPDATASLLYMFNIHAFREQWELMPTAISLRQLIENLGYGDSTAFSNNQRSELRELTGLSGPQLERCRIILTYPEKYQRLSLEIDTTKRIPSNFWIELYPVLNLAEEHLPKVGLDLTRDEVTERMVEKYQAKKVKSVIHFRRISEAFEVSQEADDREEVIDRLREFILDEEMETIEAFDGFVRDRKRFEKVLDASEKFMKLVTRAKIDHTLDGKDALVEKLREVLEFVTSLLDRLEGGDPPDTDQIAKPI